MCQPKRVAVTEGKKHNATADRTLRLSKRSIIAIDKNYNDHACYKQLTGPQ